MTKKALVLCTGNSCRSHTAEGYLRYFAGEKAETYSAGIETQGVNQSLVFRINICGKNRHLRQASTR